MAEEKTVTIVTVNAAGERTVKQEAPIAKKKASDLGLSSAQVEDLLRERQAKLKEPKPT